MGGFLDIHCHVLPGLDDGPRDMDGSVAVVTGLERVGFAEIYPTPHSKPGSWDPTPEEANGAHAALCEALRAAGSRAVVHSPAREVMVQDRLAGARPETLPSYPGAKAFLLEFRSHGPPPGIEDRLFELRVGGLLPVIAHVERFESITEYPSRLERLGRVAALQVNLASLGGWWYGRTARKLVKLGLVHLVATDIHSPSELDALKRGMQWIEATLGSEALDQLLAENPGQVLRGDLPPLWG